MKRNDSRLLTATLALLALLGPIGLAADEAQKHETERTKLSQLQFLVGSWKGVAQPQRGSSKGSWVEQAEWAWRFDEEKAELVAELSGSKLFSTVVLQPADDQGSYTLLATPAGGGEPVRYSGQLDNAGKLTLNAETAVAELPARISLRTGAGGNRLLVLYEKNGPGERLVRLAEVGYTRKGSGFGKGTSGPECVVTGGFGSIEVTHLGKTYYVCCTGCRDYFNEKPDEVLAEYAERKAEEKRQAAKGQ